MKAKTLILALVALLAIGCLFFGCKKREVGQSVSQDTTTQEEQLAVDESVTDDTDLIEDESMADDVEEDTEDTE